ncbi:hypothetical protein [Oceaniglobus indicus]|uniref:hypothetical protein n=1 Tax=Oceaniglobus indicus TaxID=2047749 RepID=UPI000C181172|nr:hypothetical protein [Oceaniglobus indicus]
MSAPKTNIEEQEKKHRPALWGMKGVAVFAAVILVIFIVYIFAQGDSPDEAGAEVDGRTGEVEETPAN